MCIDADLKCYKTRLQPARYPDAGFDYTEIVRQMRINVDLLKQEITDHADAEISRMKNALEEESELRFPYTVEAVIKRYVQIIHKDITDL